MKLGQSKVMASQRGTMTPVEGTRDLLFWADMTSRVRVCASGGYGDELWDAALHVEQWNACIFVHIHPAHRLESQQCPVPANTGVVSHKSVLW